MTAGAADTGGDRKRMELFICECVMYLSCVFEIYLLFYFLKDIFSAYEERICVRVMFTAGCAAILYAVNSLQLPGVNMICALCVCELYIWLVFRAGWKESITYLIFFFVLFIIAEFVFMFLYGLLEIDVQRASFRRVCILMLEKLFEFVIIQILRKKRHYLSGKTGDSKVKSLFIQPVSIWLLLNGIVILGHSPFDKLCIFAGGILSIISNIVDFSLVDRLLEAEHSLKEKELVQLKTVLEHSHYLKMEKLNREYADYLHEARHIVQTIRQFSETENTGALKELSIEASRFLDRKDRLDTEIYLRDPIVNAVLMERAERAKGKGIRYEVMIQPGVELEFLRETDKIRIFGNLIDNALEAAEICENGYVSIDLRMENANMLIMKITNSCPRRTVKKRTVFQTTKKDQRKHGFGLKNVSELAEQYQGLLDITEEENEFIVLLVLSNMHNIQKNKKVLQKFV